MKHKVVYTRSKTLDAEMLFAQLDKNTGEFPEDVLNDAIDQRELIVPLLLEELRCALKE